MDNGFRPLWGPCLSQFSRNLAHVRLTVFVPYGDHVYLNEAGVPTHIVQDGFRPLWGPCLSQCVNIFTDGGKAWCFRPLWGPCLSQFVLILRINPRCVVFVPYGDHVYLNDNGGSADGMKAIVFSSPMGTMSISIRLKLATTETEILVFVPYGDHVYLNRKLKSYWQKKTMFSSPMGTMSISISYTERSLRLCWFSSPMGTMSISIGRNRIALGADAFSSPMGTMSISICQSRWRMLVKTVFVPYGDHVYLNQ